MFGFWRKQSSGCTNCWGKNDDKKNVKKNICKSLSNVWLLKKAIFWVHQLLGEKAMIYCSVIICSTLLISSLHKLFAFFELHPFFIFVHKIIWLQNYLLCLNYFLYWSPWKLFAILISAQNYLLYSSLRKIICYTHLCAKLFAILSSAQNYLLLSRSLFSVLLIPHHNLLDTWALRKSNLSLGACKTQF